MAEYYGFNPPFIGGPQNVLSRQEDHQLIKNDLLQLLLTSPGDRVNRPDFGTPLRGFLFENNYQNDLDILRSDIVRAITVFEPRVNILNVVVTQSDDPNGIRIFISVSLKNDPKTKLAIDRFLQSPTNSEI